MVPDIPLVLVDGSSYLFRAYHALPPLSNSRGEPTGAIYGVANMLRKLAAEYEPVHMAVVFDAKGPTFRNEIYPEYKANRPPTPPDLDSQVEPLLGLIEAMGLTLLMVAGVEADDVIGTLCRQARESGMDIVVSTGDKDLAQLVDAHTTLINTMTGTVLDRDGVMDKFGVPPERIVDFLALVGDSIDNIPGVPKCGPKTAAKWLNQYGDLDGVMAHANEVRGKIGENLRASLDQLPVSRQLATIRQDVQLPVALEDLKRRAPSLEELKGRLEDLEFKSWRRELDANDAASSEGGAVGQPPADYALVLARADLDAWIARLETAELFAFDTETTSLNARAARLVGVSFAVEGGQAAYVPCGHSYAGAPEQISCPELLAALKPLLEAEGQVKVMQNLKYDAQVLANYGVEVRGVRFDTMLESYVLNSTAGRHDMDSLAQKYLDHSTIHYEDIAGRGAHQLTFDQIPLEQAAPYAAEDADVTLRLHQRLWPDVAAEPALARLFSDIEMPLAAVLGRMERNGVLVDAAMLRRQSEEIAGRMAAIEARAFDAAGTPFNLGSPKQIQEMLFDRMALPVVKRTPKGQPSTAEDVLEQLAADYELPRLILEHRGLAKLKSTYTDKLPRQIDPDTGRVHTSYQQAVAATGRLSSTDPNLQNIPVRTEEGRRIRKAFIAPEDSAIVAADYSQIELRIMAHLSGDEGLLAAFEAGEDIHRATAAEVFGLPLAEVSAEQRRSAKAINFGLIYGMSAFGLARQLGIARDAAQAYVERYFARYPGVRAYMERTRDQAHRLGYVETLFGRRLYLAEINARSQQRRQAAERAAINAPMQGTAADIIKRAMIAVDRWIREAKVDIKMIMQVHDELVFEVPQARLAQVRSEVPGLMAGAADLAVPLVVDLGAGANWDEAH
jgi:DNA polymerase-1